MTPNCLTCRHAEPVELTDLALECRRYPPSIHFHDDESFMVFPQVFEGDWCGEWAAPTKPETVGSDAQLRPQPRNHLEGPSIAEETKYESGASE